MLRVLLGIGFAALSDIKINGFSPAAAIVGEFLPAAGPNLIFAAILVPLFVGATSPNVREVVERLPERLARAEDVGLGQRDLAGAALPGWIPQAAEQ